MTYEEKMDFINDVYNRARIKNLCDSKKQFAALLGMSPSTLASAMNGSEQYLTDNLVKRIQVWSEQTLKEETPIQQTGPVMPSNGDVIIPAATVEMYTAMAKSIEKLSDIVKVYQMNNYIPGSQPPKNQQTKH